MIQGAVTSDLFNVADSQTALLMLDLVGGSEWAHFDFQRNGIADRIAEQELSQSLTLLEKEKCFLIGKITCLLGDILYCKFSYNVHCRRIDDF